MKIIRKVISVMHTADPKTFTPVNTVVLEYDPEVIQDIYARMGADGRGAVAKQIGEEFIREVNKAQA